MLFNQKTTLILGIFSCFLMLVTKTYAQHDRDKAVINALSYLVEEENYIEQIKQKYPALKDTASIVEKLFDTTFYQSRVELEKLYINDLETFKYNLIENSTKYFQEINPSEKQAREFLKRVSDKSAGKIDKPILETLLTYEYMDRPLDEFTAGYTKKFCTEGHLKSKGLNFTLTLPDSWRQMENDKPHSFEKFVSGGGFGSEILLLMVRDVKSPVGKSFNQKEINDILAQQEIIELLPKDSKYVSTKNMILGAHSANQLLYQHTGPHHIKTQVDTYVILVNSKAAILQFTMGALFTDSIEERFQQLLSLYNAIINSLQFSEGCK